MTRAHEVPTHELKLWPQFFTSVIQGAKTFEVRRNDRGYREGDTLLLREWDPDSGAYTGRLAHARVGYLLPGGEHGIEEGYVVMGLNQAALCRDLPCHRVWSMAT